MSKNAIGQQLIIIRGNSGSGKTTIAHQLRDKSKNKRNVAVISQDKIRRELLKEHDEPGARNIKLIKLIIKDCLDLGFYVILEGILTKERYGDMLIEVISSMPHNSHVYYLDIPLEETLRRHVTKSNAHEFGEKEIRQWYREKDYLGIDIEVIIDETSSEEATIQRILQDTQL